MKKSFKQKVSLVLAGAMTLSAVMVQTGVTSVAAAETTGVGTKTANADGSYAIEWDMTKVDINSTWFVGGVDDEFGLSLGSGFKYSADDHSATAADEKLKGTDPGDAGYADTAIVENFPNVAANQTWICGGANPKFIKEDGTYSSGTDGAIPTQGAFIKFVAPDNGELEFVTKIGKNADGTSKVGYFLGTDGIALLQLTGEGIDKSYYFSFDEIEKGETYYIFAQGSKTRFSGIRFTAAAGGDTPTETTTVTTPTEATTVTATEATTEAPTVTVTETATETTTATADPVISAGAIVYIDGVAVAASEVPSDFSGLVVNFTADKDIAELKDGETFNVDVKLSGNTAGISAFLFKPDFKFYDAAGNEVTDVATLTAITEGDTTQFGLKAGKVIDGEAALAEIQKDGNTFLDWVDNPVVGNGTVFTLTFTKAKAGFASFSLDLTPDGLADGSFNAINTFAVAAKVVKVADYVETTETTTVSTTESTTESTTATTTEPTTVTATETTTVSTTEATTATTTETTTATETTTKKSSSSSSGGGGGSSSSKASSNNDSLKPDGSGTKEPSTDKPSTSTPQYSFTTANGTVIAPPVNAVYSKSFDDISNRAWAVSSINKLASLGIINGVADGKFNPDASSKRADFIIMLDKILGLSGYASDNFDDVESGKYYANYIGLAKEVGVATGYGDGNFGPEATISRQDMMVLVAKTLEFCGQDISADESVLDQFSDADNMASYAKPYAAYLVQAGMVNGTGDKIDGSANMTRAQMSVLMNSLYDAVYEIAYDNYVAEQAAAADEETTVEEDSTEATTSDDEESTTETTTSDEESTTETTTEAE